MLYPKLCFQAPMFFFSVTHIPVIFLRDGFPKRRYDMNFIYTPKYPVIEIKENIFST